MRTSSFLTQLLQVLFPSTCACCNEVLADNERQICHNCLNAIGKAHVTAKQKPIAKQRLRGAYKLVEATAVYRFHHDGAVRAAVHAMKYHACTELCEMMGQQMGLALLQSGQFDGIDLLMPVPLHWIRRLRRGYNQSELLCRGIAKVMPIPIDTHSLVRHRHTRQQSRQQHEYRAMNVDGAFRVQDVDALTGKHILLVDDVLTTGATLKACCRALNDVPGLNISIATFSIAL